MNPGIALRPTLSLVLTPVGKMQQILEPRMNDNFYEAVNYWTSSNPASVRFNVGDEERVIPFVVAPDDWVECMVPGEKYGFYVGDMMFLNDSMIRDNPKWAPFVVAKLYGERYVDKGLDPTGHQKHYDALFRTIRGALGILDSGDFLDFLTNLMKHERSGYFEWDTEAERFLQGGDTIDEAKRAYLERHHQSKWVTMSRNWEVMASVAPDIVGGFRNYAEVLTRRIAGEGTGALYSAALLVQALMREPFDGNESGPFIVEGPTMSGLAYMLTQEANGIVDLVRFVDDPILEGLSLDSNAIVRINSRRNTWNALSKRLSYRMTILESGARNLIEKERRNLDNLIIDFRRFNEGASIMIDNARTMEKPNAIDVKSLARLETSYPSAVVEFQKEVTRAAENIARLEELRESFRSAV